VVIQSIVWYYYIINKMTIVKMKGNSSVNSVNINSNMKGKNLVVASSEASEASEGSSTTSSISSTSTISSSSTKQSSANRSPKVIKTDLRPEVYSHHHHHHHHLSHLSLSIRLKIKHLRKKWRSTLIVHTKHKHTNNNINRK